MKMKKNTKKLDLILFGAGLIGRQVLPRYLHKFNILAFVDNDPRKHNGTISNIDIIHPEQIQKYKYDYIVITSTSIEPIKAQLIELGLQKEKITQYIDHVAIIKHRFPFDAVIFILLCVSLLSYLFSLLIAQ